MDFDDDDDLDFDFGCDPPGPDDPPGDPTYRATVHGDRLTVIHWMPHLRVGPVHRAMLREREASGITMADLTRLGESGARELVVHFLARGGGRAAERVLGRWAASTGHARMWLPERVVELRRPHRLGAVATTCPTCGTAWREAEPQFWAVVQEAGTFPTYCLLCGGDLPQWTAARARGGRESPRRLLS